MNSVCAFYALLLTFLKIKQDLNNNYKQNHKEYWISSYNNT